MHLKLSQNVIYKMGNTLQKKKKKNASSAYSEATQVLGTRMTAATTGPLGLQLNPEMALLEITSYLQSRAKSLFSKLHLILNPEPNQSSQGIFSVKGILSKIRQILNPEPNHFSRNTQDIRTVNASIQEYEKD